MTAHPDLVSGTRRNDQDFMRAGRGDWVTKVGADGVQAFASRSRAQAFAIKIADGSKVASAAATVAVLDQLGWLDEGSAKPAGLARRDHCQHPRRTRGRARAVFTLQFEG